MDQEQSRDSSTDRRTARVVMQVRWSDVDLFGHVNNAAFLRYLDDARFSAFPMMGVDANGALTDALLVVVKHEIDYVAPLTFTSAPIAVEVWVPRIGGSSVDFGYVVSSGETVHLRARSRMVQLDRRTYRPRSFDEAERAALAAYPGDEPGLRPW